MKPMYLSDVEAHVGTGRHAAAIAAMREAGIMVPQILHLFAFRPERTSHLARFTHEVMRGPSLLTPGERELIAAFTSGRNSCVF
jgi:hypothetical protein